MHGAIVQWRIVVYKKIRIIIRTKARTSNNRGRIIYKKGGNQRKGAQFGTFLYFLLKKNVFADYSVFEKRVCNRSI